MGYGEGLEAVLLEPGHRGGRVAARGQAGHVDGLALGVHLIGGGLAKNHRVAGRI